MLPWALAGLLAGLALQADAAPAMSGNFRLHPGQTGATGHSLVTADWTSYWGNGGDYFTGDASAYDILIGPNANLYAVNNNASGGCVGPSTVSLAGGSVTNCGMVTVVPNTYPNYSVNNFFNTLQPAINVTGGPTTVTNYGTIGFQPVNAQMPYEAIIQPSSGVVHNYGTLVGLHGVYGGGQVYNHAGGKIIAWFGTPVEFPNGSNFQYGGLMNDIYNGSYCFHPGYLTKVYNWGYCIASANGFWLDQHDVYGYDYGGPLVPAAHDLDGNLVFNGNLTGDYEYNSYNAYQGSSCEGFPGSTPVLAINNAVATLANTVYTVAGSGALVNYLPLTYGYQMINSGNRTGNLVLNFSHLTASQQQMITSTVANSWVSYTDKSGNQFPHVSTGSFTLFGHAYTWCTFGAVTLNFSDTIIGHGKYGLPLPGIYWKSGTHRAYFTDATSTTNPYLQTSAASVQLTGSVAEPAGQLVVQPGWTLQLGNQARMLVNYQPQSNLLDDDFAPALVAGNSINLQAASATTTDNVDGVMGQTTTLYGALVIDNPTKNVVLPNLAGGGWLIQSGMATTTLAGSNNTFTGSIYLARGRLALTPATHFAKAPSLLIGTNDASQINSPVFDISGIGSNGSFTLGSLSTPGYQLQVYPTNSWSGLQYPTISLGSNTLVIGDGRVASGRYLGIVTGSGGLRIAKGTTLTYGPISPTDISHFGKIVPMSTFSGGITVDAGGTFVVQTEGGFGTGNVTNGGTIALASGWAYTPTQAGITLPAGNAMPNHTLSLPAGYTQASTGKLVLRVALADASGAASTAGMNYDTVAVAGAANLAGRLQINLIGGYVPAKGSTLHVLTAGSLTGGFAGITVMGAKVSATQVVAGNSITVTLHPH